MSLHLMFERMFHGSPVTPFRVVCIASNRRMIDFILIGRDLEGCGLGLIEVLPRNFSGEIEGNDETLQSCSSRGPESN
jgi:hypothetical protein